MTRCGYWRRRRCLDNVLHGRLEIGMVSGIVPEYFSHYSHYRQTREYVF